MPGADISAAGAVRVAAGMRFTIDIDTGGTFTDCYVTGGPRFVVAKTDTTPHDLSQGVLACIDRAAEAMGLTRRALLQRCDAVRLSTTIGTNTFINRNGAKVGLLIGAEAAPLLDRLAPALPLDRDCVATIPEAAETRAVREATRLLLERGARILVIGLGGGAGLPERETAVRQIIAEDYPRHYLGAVPVLCSHQVTPIADPLLRLQTAVVDAYIHPVMGRFLYRVEDLLRGSGLARPLQVGNANGGTSRVAKTTALHTWGSGPAGGVAGATAMAGELGLAAAVAIDIGGTSADVSVIRRGIWETEATPEIEGVRVALPTLRLHSVGIGCGSIARVVDGALTIGPDSAGAQPGPAAFGLGGGQATVTDAICCLGIFDPARFLGGRRALDIAAARRVVAEKIAAPLGLTVEAAAAQVVDRAAAKIAAVARGQLALFGLDPARCALFATGGGGGILGHGVARHGGFTAATCFLVSPVFSAFGLSRLDVIHCYEAAPTLAELEPTLDRLRRAALADMRSEGFPPAAVALTVEAEFDDADPLGADFARALAILPSRDAAPRLLRLTATAPGRRAALPSPAAAEAAAPVGTRRIHWGAQAIDTPVLDWAALAEGTIVDGPAVLETAETTLLVPPGAGASLGALGEVIIAAVPAPQLAEPTEALS